MPAWSGYEKCVRLSVKRVDCDKTEEKSVQIFIPYERSFYFFEKENGWWGVFLSPNSIALLANYVSG